MGKPLQRQRLPRVVGEVGLDLLNDARRARPRITDPGDAEGLHDFRVALRRLRAWLQAYRGQPGIAFSKSLRRDLRDLARATNRARDGEVMLAWLGQTLPSLPAAERGAGEWWRQRLELDVAEAYESANLAVETHFPGLDARLQSRLDKLRTRKKGRAPSFGEASAVALSALRERLVAEVEALGSVEDAESLHRPRITGKRIRYLLRPWRKASLRCRRAERAMKAFQDAFGVLHDDLVRESAMRDMALAQASGELEARLVEVARGGTPRASAPRHLRGFMGLVRENRRRLLAHYEIAVGVEGAGGIEALSMRLEAACAAMREISS
ncbi:CHAD domain-containing protein [Halomonas caseinilytica]|uniref:CHAD domain-containing protein n=1 Tax=Halomonas caseinilytica TaxID=438744 RepID=UPI0007E55311|nr:CHAD domain-containing protein [Halomonas caseinilytica]SEM70550.1 CHAD domain-containing protein [Halomonas caseinilytica]